MTRVIAALASSAAFVSFAVLALPPVAHAEMDLPNPRLTEPAEPFGITAPLVCATNVRPGTQAFGDLIHDASGYRVIVEPRPCPADGEATSHHHSGRALDVMIDVRTARTKNDGKALLEWLFFRDGARVKRLGIVEIIWNDRIWTTAMDSANPTPKTRQWRDHRAADCPEDGETACHYNHIHFTLSKAGAAQDTTYWTAQA